MTSSPQGSLSPGSTPPSWHFAKLLLRVRAKREITVDEACASLPGVSPRHFEAWEHGRRTPPSWVQTLVVWRLNTASNRVFTKANSTQRRLGFLSSSVPTGAFIVAALFATLLWMRFERQQHLHIDPAILAEHICKDALAHGRTGSTPEDYAAYATGLSKTLTQFTRREWDLIVGVQDEH